MKRQLIVTNDGSHTISIPAMQVTYHSMYGAIQESKHIFINAGFHNIPNQSLDILEIGFGAGLNAILTLIEAEANKKTIHYTAIEKFPLTINEAAKLNYCEIMGRHDLKTHFSLLHSSNWNETVTISDFFTLHKINHPLQSYQPDKEFNLVYFDAFAPAVQPELWTQEIFQKIFICLKRKGIMLTYCSKGDVRRAMLASGFTVKKIPGPPGKREILCAEKV